MGARLARLAMKLLVVTQAVDTEDPVLGFFVHWIEEFSKRVEHTEVICLKLGRSDLPKNVGIYSLGKERGAASRAAYAWRFLSLAWKLRNDYDAVFVHMNQEYILLAGWLWKLLGKRVYLWRNHYAGSLFTDVAAMFCTKVFCTSRYSYTARYKKAMLMPVGIDTDRFFPDARVARTSHSIFFLARMSPSKRPEMLIDALAMLAREGQTFTSSFVGSPLPQDEVYYEGLKEKVRALGLADRITFLPGVPNDQTPDLYRAHEVFVNASPSGMLDKTIFEAAASGCLVLVASVDIRKEPGGECYTFQDAADLAGRLKGFFRSSREERDMLSHTLVAMVGKNSLKALGTKIYNAF